jgi:eukaryotic-like serine/threonine-protein kinase
VLEVGRYELHHELASGGMATVYLGRLRGPVGFSRTVAIKRLHPQFAKQPDFVAMFVDEARLASRIVHPNVVPMLDVVAESGELFLVMEYVHGESLSELTNLARASGERIPLRIASAIVGGLLEGLHAAHESKDQHGQPLDAVHRDVSPQNVLVGVDGATRVLDFGIAKATDRLQITRDGGLKGKVAYMAPEQLRLEPVDRRADVYAAGVVLWELITGQRLRRANNAVSALHEVDQPILAPSSIDPAIVPEVDGVTLRALASRPDQRFQTAREFAQALEAAVPPAPPRVVGEWVERLADAALKPRASLVVEVQGTQATASVVSAPPSPSSPAGQARTPVPVTSATPAPSSRRWLGYVVALAAGAAVASLAALLVSRDAGERPGPSAVPPAVAAPPRSLPAVSASPTSAEPQVIPQVASPPASPSARAAAPQQRQARRPKPNCNPPFVIDRDGIKTYKPGCLK